MKDFSTKSWLLAVAILAFASCSKDTKNDPSTDTDTDTSATVPDKYFFAATAGDYTYVMAVSDLAKDTTITTKYPGSIEHQGSYTQWGYNGTDALFAIEYRQGNPAPGSVFQLSAAGDLKQMNDFILDKGFNTIGSFSHYLVAGANGETLTGEYADKTGTVFYSFDLSNNNTITPMQVMSMNFVGDQTASFVGIADAGSDNFFSAVNLAVGASGRAVNVDSIYVAKFDASMKLVKLYADNRLSFSGGQFRSARYGQMVNDADGNTYVFSTGYGTTTKKCGALLISKNSDAFDSNYYFDIETASGGYKLRKVWNITGDYFLLEMYNTAGVAASTAAATQYGIVRMSTKAFTWVRDGFPAIDIISSVGWPFTADGKAYIPVVTTDAYPTVYVIDPATAIATKGISISDATAIPGLGKLAPQASIQ